MQLDPHSIVVVMVVVFASTLLISAGLLLALGASAAGRLWAGGHLVLSAGGLGLAANMLIFQRPGLAALSAALFTGGKLALYAGVRVYQNLPPAAHLHRAVLLIAVVAVLAALWSPATLIHVVQAFYLLLAMLSLLTVRLLAKATRVRSEIGLPLVLLASSVQLAVQLYGLGMSFDAAVAIGPLHQPGGDNGVLVMAALVATLLGLFGYTVMALEQVIANKERNARIDGLTGLLNRTALDGSAASLVSAALRHRQSLSCLVIDVDHFKQVNDRHGHAAGDAVLQAIAQALDNSRRASDVAGRYGGEEFCVLCPHTDEQQATALARRILRKVRAIPLPGTPGGFASVSIGIAQLREEPGDAHTRWLQLFSHADRALYEAKRQGRDRYALSSLLSPSTPAPPLDALSAGIAVEPHG